MKKTLAQVAIERWWEHLRITLLRSTDELKDHGANESLLMDILADAQIYADRKQVREALVWLATRKLVKTREVGKLMLVEITEIGEAVIAGRRSVPGVRSPSRRV